jgi:hypothetical protein
MSARSSTLGLLGLTEVRRWARKRWGRVLAVVVAFHYSLLSMYASGMLLFVPTGQPLSSYFFWGTGQPDWWNYPAWVILGPNVAIALPLPLVITMVLVASALGLDVAAAANLLWNRHRSDQGSGTRDAARASAIPLQAEAAPAVVALVSLGTGCGADFAVGGLALFGGSVAATRTTLASISLLLGLFDVFLIGVSLLLLERVLRSARMARPPVLRTPTFQRARAAPARSGRT